MVSIRSSCAVKPSEPTPNVKLWLPECDQIKAYTHVPAFFVYRPNNNSVVSPFNTLKTSLSSALVSYYPLAGRLNWISGGRFELHCNGMGAELVEAESESQIKDYANFCPTSETRKLLPYVDYTKDITALPLLLVQVTNFKCGGLTVGILLSHIATDGKAIFAFFESWMNIARGEKVTANPCLDRKVFYKGDPLAKPRFDHVEFKPFPVLIGQSDINEERQKETTTNLFKLSKDEVDALKRRANEGRVKDGMTREYTRYEAICAHIWRCASKARRLRNEQLTALRMMVDCRNRLQPKLPLNYCGNATMPTTATAEVGQLLSNQRGLRYACSLIRESVDMVNNDYVKSAVDFLSAQQDATPFRTGFHYVNVPGVQFLGNPNLAITSWFGLPLDIMDFGWGKPVFMGPVELGNDGRAYIIHDVSGDGSVIVPIRLQVVHMDAFKKLFYKELPGAFQNTKNKQARSYTYQK